MYRPYLEAMVREEAARLKLGLSSMLFDHSKECFTIRVDNLPQVAKYDGWNRDSFRSSSFDVTAMDFTSAYVDRWSLVRAIRDRLLLAQHYMTPPPRPTFRIAIRGAWRLRMNLALQK